MKNYTYIVPPYFKIDTYKFACKSNHQLRSKKQANGHTENMLNGQKGRVEAGTFTSLGQLQLFPHYVVITQFSLSPRGLLPVLLFIDFEIFRLERLKLQEVNVNVILTIRLCMNMYKAIPGVNLARKCYQEINRSVLSNCK